MKRSMFFVAIILFGGIILAQEKTVEPGQSVTLKPGESAVVEEAKGNPADLLPKDCKDWNVAELPGFSDSIFVCKAGKWIEYVRKDKVPALCAEAKTEVKPVPKPATNPK